MFWFGLDLLTDYPFLHTQTQPQTGVEQRAARIDPRSLVLVKALARAKAAALSTISAQSQNKTNLQRASYFARTTGQRQFQLEFSQ